MITDNDLLLLSAYIDNELADDERHQLEVRIQREPELQTELDELRQVVNLVKLMPMVKSPRNFTLDPAQFASRPTPIPLRRADNVIYSWQRVVAAIAAILIVAVVGIFAFNAFDDTSTNQSNESVALQEQPAPAESQAERLQEVAVAPTPMVNDAVSSEETRVEEAQAIAPLESTTDNFAADAAPPSNSELGLDAMDMMPSDQFFQPRTALPPNSGGGPGIGGAGGGGDAPPGGFPPQQEFAPQPPAPQYPPPTSSMAANSEHSEAPTDLGNVQPAEPLVESDAATQGTTSIAANEAVEASEDFDDSAVESEIAGGELSLSDETTSNKYFGYAEAQVLDMLQRWVQLIQRFLKHGR